MMLNPIENPRPNTGERLRIENANEIAVIHGPMNQLPVTWLRNGPDGLTLPEEMVSVGYHIMHPERMPDWLIAKLDAAERSKH